MAQRKISKRVQGLVEKDLRSQNYGNEEIATRRGVSNGYISGLKRKLDLPKGARTMDPEGDLKKREQKSEIQRTKKSYQEALGKIEELQRQLSHVSEGVNLARHYRPMSYRPKSLRKGEAVATVYLGDWHLEETVTLESVNGVNKFDKGVRRKRLDSLWPSIASLVEMCRSRSRIDTLVIYLGGDFITGWLHDELVATNQSGPHAASFDAFNELANGLRFLGEELKPKKILLPCAIGNHGRITKKKWSKDTVESSFDWLIYRFLAQWFEQMPVKGVDMQFQLPVGAMCYLDLYGKRVRLTHGDDIQYYGGTGGVTIPARKAIDGWNSTNRADYTVMGHFHNDQSDVDYRISGALIGYSEFALKCKARFSLPSQAFELHHPRYGVTARFPIILPKGF